MLGATTCTGRRNADLLICVNDGLPTHTAQTLKGSQALIILRRPWVSYANVIALVPSTSSCSGDMLRKNTLYTAPACENLCADVHRTHQIFALRQGQGARPELCAVL